MGVRIRRLGAAIGLGAVLVTAGAMPGLAIGPSAAPAASAPGGRAAVVDRGGRHGIVLFDWADRAAADGRLALHLTGLTPGARLRVVLSSAPCGQPSPPRSRLFAAPMTVGLRGEAWRDWDLIALRRGTFADARSVRLMEEEGIFVACTRGSVWDDTDIVHVLNGALVVFDEGDRRGIAVFGPAGDAGTRFAYSLTIGPDVRGVLAGTTTGCDVEPDRSDVLLALPVDADASGSAFARGRTETVDKDETITIGAFRLRAAGGPPWACAPAVLIALLLP